MNLENTKRLYEDFPYLYRGRRKSIRQSLMPFGFECGDGWFAIIYKLSADIEALAKATGLDPLSNRWPEVIQVKEKYGTLRYYLRDTLDAELMHNLVGAAYKQSSRTCEDCGQPGTLSMEGWWNVRCAACKVAQ